MPDLGTQLRQYYDTVTVLTDPADVVAGRARTRAVLEPETPAAWWRRPAVVAVGAAALVVVLVGGIALLSVLGGGEPAAEPTTVTVPATTLPPTSLPPTTATPTPTTEVTTTTAGTTTTEWATTTTQPTPEHLRSTWDRVPSAPALEDGWIGAATEGGPGLVAVGGSYGRLDASVWVSEDGTAWERVEAAAFGAGADDGDQYMVDVISTPFGLVAVGAADDAPSFPSGTRRAAVWLSADGRSWSRVTGDDAVFPPGSAIERVVAGGPGLVAVGSTDGAPTIWTSPDGEAWARVEDDLEPDGVTATLLDVAVRDGVLVAVGYTDPYRDSGGMFPPGGEQDLRPAVWVSDDGLVWERISDDAVEEGSEPGGWTQGVSATEDGFVAVGSAAWTSQDGRRWDLVGGPTEWVAGSLLGTRAMVTEIDGRVLAAFLPGVQVWGSDDGGATWYPSAEVEGGFSDVLASSPPANQSFGTVNQVIPVGDALMAVGSFVEWSGSDDLGAPCETATGSCRADAAIWIGDWEG